MKSNVWVLSVKLFLLIHIKDWLLLGPHRNTITIVITLGQATSD